jgi:transcriptional regulator with XRE-family HTH domain
MRKKGAAKGPDGGPLPVNVYIGLKIRTARETVNGGMSQEKLGQAINLDTKNPGVTFQQVQKYENGTNTVSVPRLIEIAAATRRDPAWFIAGAPGTNGATGTAANDPVLRLTATRDGTALAIAFTAIADPEMRAAIVRVVAQISARSQP